MAKEERLSLSREDAARVVLVKTLECDCPPKDWSNAQGDQASIDARHLLGDKANKATWLVQRAKLILTRTNQGAAGDRYCAQSWLVRDVFRASHLRARDFGLFVGSL